jgi:type IV pilus assembly protein PilX
MPRQHGFINTLLAIVVVVATLIAAAAVMRSVANTSMAATSSTFRQGVLQEASRAYTHATKTLDFRPSASVGDVPANGYYATLQPATHGDRQGVPDVLVEGLDGRVARLAALETRNRVSYVVERLCQRPGNANPDDCIIPGTVIGGGTVSNGTSDPGASFNATGGGAGFRLTVRVDGPRDTVAYVQTVLR